MRTSKPKRLIDILLDSGYFPRRKAFSYIKRGHIKVDGKPVRDPNAVIDPFSRRITFKGYRINPYVKKKEYVIYNKPPGEFFVPKKIMHLLPLEPLHAEDMGLMILTNDSELLRKFRNSYIKRTYIVKLKKPPKDRLRIEGAKYTTIGKNLIRLTTAKLKFHQLREKIPHVENVKRIEIEPIALPEDLKEGQYRHLEPDEELALVEFIMSR